MRLIIFNTLFLFLIFNTGYSVIHAKVDFKSIHKFKRILKNERLEMRLLRKKISRAELRLNRNNKVFIKNQNKINDLETGMQNKSEELSKQLNEIKNADRNNRKIVGGYLVNSLDEQDEITGLISANLLGNVAKSKIRKNISDKEMQKALYLELNKLKLEHQLLEEKNSMIKNSLTTLEIKKKKYADRYIFVDDHSEKISNKIKELVKLNKQRKKVPKKIKTWVRSDIPRFTDLRGKLITPIVNYSDYHVKNKGVTFIYKKQQPVYAVGSGRVVYAGSLSKYGNIILIDHGESIRSVVLGTIDIKINKGDFVEKGHIVGYVFGNSATSRSKKTEKLYFEMREKRVVQNSIEWLDEKVLYANKNMRNSNDEKVQVSWK